MTDMKLSVDTWRTDFNANIATAGDNTIIRLDLLGFLTSISSCTTSRAITNEENIVSYGVVEFWHPTISNMQQVTAQGRIFSAMMYLAFFIKKPPPESRGRA